MSISFHSESGHVIAQANSWNGKWKIPAEPGRAYFFKTLSDARKWAKKHPKDDVNPLGAVVDALAGKVQP